jgi:hypothetical protein
MKIIAIDTAGNEFPKTVTKQDSPYGFSKGEPMISFGWPVEYMVSFILSHYPYQHPLIIDICGTNHRGYQVEVPATEMDRIVEELIQK